MFMFCAGLTLEITFSVVRTANAEEKKATHARVILLSKFKPHIRTAIRTTKLNTSTHKTKPNIYEPITRTNFPLDANGILGRLPTIQQFFCRFSAINFHKIISNSKAYSTYLRRSSLQKRSHVA
jgi:hypothetical protein